MPRFWTLARLSIALQITLVVLVVAVLVISMQTLVTQSAEFARQAEDRARAAEAATPPQPGSNPDGHVHSADPTRRTDTGHPGRRMRDNHPMTWLPLAGT